MSRVLQLSSHLRQLIELRELILGAEHPAICLARAALNDHDSTWKCRERALSLAITVLEEATL